MQTQKVVKLQSNCNKKVEELQKKLIMMNNKIDWNKQTGAILKNVRKKIGAKTGAHQTTM